MAVSNRNRLLEKYVEVVREDGLNTNKNVNIGIAGAGSTATLSVGTGGINTTGTISGITAGTNSISHTGTAINSSATATATQFATGYITSTSGSAVTLTLPTATAVATQIGAVAGTIFDLWIDNTAGANTVTVVAGAGMTASVVAQVATYGVPTFGLLTVASGASGQGCFRFAFSSATACTWARVF
jgi:hypothetical protein